MTSRVEQQQQQQQQQQQATELAAQHDDYDDDDGDDDEEEEEEEEEEERQEQPPTVDAKKYQCSICKVDDAVDISFDSADDLIEHMRDHDPNLRRDKDFNSSSKRRGVAKLLATRAADSGECVDLAAAVLSHAKISTAPQNQVRGLREEIGEGAASEGRGGGRQVGRSRHAPVALRLTPWLCAVASLLKCGFVCTSKEKGRGRGSSRARNQRAPLLVQRTTKDKRRRHTPTRTPSALYSNKSQRALSAV